MSSESPPYVSPQPQPPVFPEAEVARMVERLEELIAELERIRTTHEHAAEDHTHPTTPFEGRAADGFREALSGQLRLLDRQVRALEVDQEMLVAGQRMASRQEERYEGQMKAWNQQREARREWLLARGHGPVRDPGCVT